MCVLYAVIGENFHFIVLLLQAKYSFFFVALEHVVFLGHAFFSVDYYCWYYFFSVQCKSQFKLNNVEIHGNEFSYALLNTIL